MLKYERWYNSIIGNALDRKLIGYKEVHHIIPRCMGGSDEETNLVELTAREHFICHILLTKFVKDSRYKFRIIRAAILMKSSNRYQDRYINGRLYETVKEEYSKERSGNSFYGKNHSKDSCLKISNSKRGKPNNSWNTGLNKDNSDKMKELGEKISNSVTGMRHWTNGIQSTKSKECPGEGWYIGRVPNDNFKYSDERKAQMKEQRSGGSMSWWNNGTINKRSKECPGEGWYKGRIFSKEQHDKFCKKIN
jgi:hypothetical protein